MLYQIQKALRTWWQSALDELDQSGFGEPIREFWGRLISELTGKTGERGKGVNFMQVFYLCMAVVLALRSQWNFFWVIVFVFGALVLFPSVRRTILGLSMPWLHRVEAPDEVFWDAEPIRPTLHPSEAKRSRRPLESLAQTLRQLNHRPPAQ